MGSHFPTSTPRPSALRILRVHFASFVLRCVHPDNLMKKVTLYSDGACEGNPGPGGWAAILVWLDRHQELSGGTPATTNNRMELQAAVGGLRALPEPCEVEFFTDSQYVRNGITDWLKN